MLTQIRLVNSIITKRGHALGVLFNRLHLAASTEQDGWKEDEEKKKVRVGHTTRIRRTY